MNKITFSPINWVNGRLISISEHIISHKDEHNIYNSNLYLGKFIPLNFHLLKHIYTSFYSLFKHIFILMTRIYNLKRRIIKEI